VASSSSAGRGVLYIAFAKFYFLFVGLFVQFKLPNILSTQEFGRYGLVNYIASWFNNVAVTGTIQSVSRFATQDPEKARAVQHAGLRMHLRIGLPLAIAFAAAAPLVAWFLHDSSKTLPLMLAGLIVGGYSFYAVFVGTANGTHQFHKQAGLDITFATLRTIGLLGMAYAGLGVAGVIGGWVAAVVIITGVAVVWVGLPGKQAAADRQPVGPLLKYFGGVAVYLLLFNALMFVDSFILERVIADRHGSAAADTMNGYYVATQQLARVSYQAIIAATFVVFPLVSRSTFTEDKDTTKRYIEVTIRYSLMFATAIAVVVSSSPADMLGVLYKPEYAAAGGPALVFLAFGNVAFALFAIAGTILNGAGRSRSAIRSAGITLAAAAIGNYIAISASADSEHVLEIAAMVTGSAMLLGALITGVQLKRMFGAALPLASFARVAIAGGAAYAVGYFAPLHGKGKLMTLVLGAAVGATFLVMLVATRELGARDLEAIKAVRRKRAPGGDA
jgi:O-antigen/teichoic acid export membrane protein